MRKEISNNTTITEFLLLGFADTPEGQILCFTLFSAIYLVALVENLLILTAIVRDCRLHTPMYLFLANLSFVDLGSISVTLPKSMVNSLMHTRSISFPGCVAQIFFLIFFIGVIFFLLTIMAYDRYVAICRPLHYERMMNRRTCVQMAAGAWIGGSLNSAMHTGNIFTLTFCGCNTVDQFFCELPQVLKLTCSHSSVGDVSALIISACLGAGCFVFIIVSYVQIFRVVLRIPSEQGRRKAFSTCLPHLAVVSLFACTVNISHLKPTSTSTSSLNLAMAVLYSTLPPVLNPIIYSMRNTEMKAALKRLAGWMFST